MTWFWRYAFSPLKGLVMDILPDHAIRHLGLNMDNAPKKPKDLQVSMAAMNIIQKYEGFVPHAYDDQDPTARPIMDGDEVDGVLTIGYGTTDPDYAFPGNVIGVAVAEKLLLQHLNENVMPTIRRLVKVPLDQPQVDALASFIYNVGSGQFASSTLLKRLNVGDYEGAAEQFLRWVYDDGKVLLGLQRRRAAEKELFESYVE